MSDNSLSGNNRVGMNDVFNGANEEITGYTGKSTNPLNKPSGFWTYLLSSGLNRKLLCVQQDCPRSRIHFTRNITQTYSVSNTIYNNVTDHVRYIYLLVVNEPSMSIDKIKP
jgi:hypothetical protein